MSDEPTSLTPHPTPAGIWEHICCYGDCKKWGANGYHEEGEARWYCSEHKHVAEARRR